MDKLQPLLTHRFWILFGLALVLPFVAWWMTAGSISAQVDERIGAIDSAFGQVPQGTALPNDTWAASAGELNDQKEAAVNEQRLRLWKRQEELMTWPDVIADKMEDVSYREEIGDDERITYYRQYDVAKRDVVEALDPYEPVTDEGLVDVSGVQMPFVDVSAEWGLSPPSTEKMWDAQEDLWLVQSLFEAIDEVNELAGAANVTEAPIRQLLHLELRGGTRSGPEPAEATGTGAPGEAGGPEEMGFPDFDQSRRGGARGTAAPATPQEIFGDDTIQQSLDAAGGGEPAAVEGPGLPGLRGNGFGSGEQPRRRYVEDGEDQPYKTRGFYMQVVMRNEWLPEFLVSLRNRPWPTTVVYVQMTAMHEDDVVEVDPGGRSGRGENGFKRDFNRRPRPRRFDLGAVNPRGFRNDFEAGGNRSGGQLTAALQDPYLVEVTVAGLMAIYKPVDPATGEPAPEPAPTEATPTPTEETPPAPTAAGDESELPADSPLTEEEPANAGEEDAVTDDADDAPATESAPPEEGEPPANGDDDESPGTNTPPDASNPLDEVPESSPAPTAGSNP